MKYVFQCPQCDKTSEVDLSIQEYADYELVCERCKVHMRRVYEMPQVAGKGSQSIKTSPSTDPSGTEGSVDPFGGCGGSCSSCMGCGF